MSNSSETRQLSEERRNEIATRALIYMKIRNGLHLNFFISDREKKNNLELMEKIKCSENEFKKFTKEGMFIIFQRYCQIMNIAIPKFDYKPDQDDTWIKRRNEIGFAIFIIQVTTDHLHLHFRQDSEDKKAQLMRAYDCNEEELKLFIEEITHLVLIKAFALY